HLLRPVLRDALTVQVHALIDHSAVIVIFRSPALALAGGEFAGVDPHACRIFRTDAVTQSIFELPLVEHHCPGIFRAAAIALTLCECTLVDPYPVLGIFRPSSRSNAVREFPLVHPIARRGME